MLTSLAERPAFVRACLGLLFLLLVPSAVGDGVCRRGDQCGRYNKVLSWRSKPYGGVRQIHQVYGGKHVADSMRMAGFEEFVESDDWDLLWTHSNTNKHFQGTVLTSPTRDRLTNTCGYFLAAGQKCSLAAYLNTLDSHLALTGRPKRKRLPTYVLTEMNNARDWLRAASAEPSKYWIMKPCTGGNSNGIQLVQGRDAKQVLAELPSWMTVAQEFVSRPYLGFGGGKFHLRPYVLVTRWAPKAVAYLYDEGLIFRSMRPYEADRPTLTHDVFSQVSNDVEALSLSHLWGHLGKKRARRVWKTITDLLAEIFHTPALRQMYGDFSAHSRKLGLSCFDVYGLDIMLDEDLRPFILEVNFNPNMWIDQKGQKTELMGYVKQPFVEQLALWAGQRLRLRPKTPQEAEAIENRTLVNFTRLVL
eukprot:TRINITY_DN60870_c0_g1_i1.p1 TRINITY_DN60870_c0_g1~~TRINITY_DN60870_c0_g1_i1.p1  ORF type:complete len:418 (-),score=42.21 TRINITY_DN60870_c0_g1_i1:69-1322(-)